MIPGYPLLWLVSLVVPVYGRDDWLREGRAELHYSWGLDGPRKRSRASAYLRCFGALEDAVWLRIRRRDRGMALQDIKYAIRSFAKNPGFTFAVLLTLALAIGANTAIFTMVDAVLLRPLPVHEPSELADIYTSCRRGFTYCTSSYPDFLDYRERNRSFTDMAAFAGTDVTLNDSEGARLVGALLVTGNYFSMLSVNASPGRMILPDDDRLGNPRAVIVLSHRVWTNDFGQDPGVIGHDVRLNDSPYTVIGVAPKNFRGTRLSQSPDMWIPFSSLSMIATGRFAQSDPLVLRNTRWIGGVIGRRRSDVTIEQARADMISVSDGLRGEYPTRGGRTITTEAMRSVTLPATSGRDIVRFVTLLMVVVGTALLIACANIANLLLARAAARRREIGVRIALGAGRGRLVRQLLTESLILSAGGALAGLAIASIALSFLSGYALPGFVSIASLDLTLDGRVVAFTGAVALFTGLLFGLAPALQTTSLNLTESLKGQSSDARLGGIMKTRGILLSIQTAMALVLLIGAGLFVRSLQNGLDADVGFETRNLAMASFNLARRQYSEPQGLRFVQDFTERARQLPGTANVSSSVYPPLARSGSGFFIYIDGYTPAEGEELRIEANWVGPDYFRTMGIRLINGRDISGQDRLGAPNVAVINETMARRWWPGEDSVGRTFRMHGDGSGSEVLIVGLAQDVKYGLNQDPEPFIYYPMAQHMGRALSRINLLVATDAAPANVLPTLRQHMRELDPDLVVSELTTLQNRFAEYLMPQRMGTTLLSTLGGLTVLLTVVGISGVVAYAVNQRRREIGIRIALGAASTHILRVIVSGAMIPVAVGVVAGLVAAFGVTRLITNFMFGVAPTDPITFFTVPLLMASVALVAAYLPARKATVVNPTEALRSE